MEWINASFEYWANKITCVKWIWNNYPFQLSFYVIGDGRAMPLCRMTIIPN